ncbi:MAG: TIGR00266 family protein [Spirochaetales bacterium]|nr:TIGR00266 family protein [Spirochaetales bacterium]
MKSHDLDYEIIGDDMQIVEIELDPGETVIAEAGAMNYIEDGITFEARMGDGSEAKGVLGKLMGAGMRALSGESIFMTHFTNQDNRKRKAAFAGPYPGKIIPVELSSLGGSLICQKEAFLAAAYGTRLSIEFTRRIGAGFFGGEGFILQRLEGDGKVFIHVGGTVIKKELSGESLRIDTGCIAAFTPSLDYSIERAGSLKSMVFGGEGLFLATLKGCGTLWLQSLPFSRLADRVIRASGYSGGVSKGESSGITGLGNLFSNR